MMKAFGMKCVWKSLGMYRPYWPYRSGYQTSTKLTKNHSGENVTLKELHRVLTLELMTIEGIKSACDRLDQAVK